MPEEPCSPHGWTVDTLETHLSEKISALDRYCVTSFAQSKERVDMALAASDKAITKAELATDKRFDAVNEFRAALSDQTRDFMPRSVYDVQHKSMSERLEIIAASVTTMNSRLVGKSEGISSVGATILGVLVGLNSLFTLGALAVAVYVALRGR